MHIVHAHGFFAEHGIIMLTLIGINSLHTETSTADLHSPISPERQINNLQLGMNYWQLPPSFLSSYIFLSSATKSILRLTLR